MATKKKTKQSQPFFKRKFAFTFWQIALFIGLFASIGTYLIVNSSAQSVANLPQCTISPSSLAQGDDMVVTAKLPPVPSDSRDNKYWVKLDVPYNTSYDDRGSYDANTGLATFNWHAYEKGRHAFYFTYTKNGKDPNYVAKKDIIRVSQTCSVNVP